MFKVEFLIEVRVLNILGFSFLLWFKILKPWFRFVKLGLCFWPLGLSFLKFGIKWVILSVIVLLSWVMMFMG